jgi:hypothetical protein
MIGDRELSLVWLAMIAGCAKPAPAPLALSTSSVSSTSGAPPPGASSPSQDPPPPNAPDPAAAAYVAAMERMSKHFVEHGTQCDALAVAIEGAKAERDELAARSSAAAHEGARADAALGRRLDAATQAIADGSIACAGNKAFIAARGKLSRTAP